jgi:hypothetical protein
LDNKSTLPGWVPKPYIWLDYDRFKAAGAIAVIDQKVRENGGSPRTETIQDRAARMTRLLIAQKERKDFLVSEAGIQAANDEVKSLIEKLRAVKLVIEDSTAGIYLGYDDKPSQPMFQLCFGDLCLIINNKSPFRIEYRNMQRVTTGYVFIALYLKSGHHDINYNETILEEVNVIFERTTTGANGWCNQDSQEDFQTSDELIDVWAKKFIQQIEEMKEN